MPLSSANSEAPAVVLARKQGLIARLAASAADIAAAQALRFEVFYEECGASGPEDLLSLRRDADQYDALCDHLLLIEEESGRLAGTCRLLPQARVAGPEGFYTAGEFDIAPVIRRHPHLGFLELGRSCTAKAWRGKAAAELLFQAIWNYVRSHNIGVMFGCASLPGTDIDRLKPALAFLAGVAPAPPEWRATALPQHRVAMDASHPHDARRTLAGLPPLLKGYLRLGCYIGDGAAADHGFGTTDILVMLPVSRINPRYFSHYGAPE